LAATDGSWRKAGATGASWLTASDQGQPQGDEDIISPGTVVMVVNLVDRPQNNGRLASVVAWQAEDRRYVIRPEGVDALVKIKPDNLVMVAAMPGEVSEEASAEQWRLAHFKQQQAMEEWRRLQLEQQEDRMRQMALLLEEQKKEAAEMEEKRQAAMAREWQEEEDWKHAMSTLRQRNLTRTAAVKTQEEIDISMSKAALEDECDILEVELKKGKGERFGFSFTSARAEYVEARGKKHVHPREGPELLRIKEIGGGGALEVWNAANAGANVLVCDRIAQINGRATIDEMQQELKKNGVARLKIVRYPEFFFADLKRGLSGGGVELPPNVFIGILYEKSSSGSGELKITKVAPEGLMDRWNKRQIAKGLYQFVVMAGMRIEAVNDVDGDAELIEQELKSGSARRLRIRRAEVSTRARSKLVSKFNVLKSLTGFGLASLMKDSSLGSSAAASSGGAAVSAPASASASASAVEPPPPAAVAAKPPAAAGEVASERAASK